METTERTTGRRPARAVALAILVAAATLPAAAQEALLVNRTGVILYITQAAEEVENGPDLAYRSVPADGVLPYDPGQWIVGFAFERGSFKFPTLALSPTELGARATPSGSSGLLVKIRSADLSTDRTITPTAVAEVISGVRIDNQYLEWVGRDPVIARAPGRPPLGSYADFGDGREPLPLAESLLWGRGGTDVEWIKGASGPVDCYIAAAAHTPFARGTSVFLFLYREGAAHPEATVEVPAEGGFVLLWLPVRPAPLVIGNVVVSGFFLEAQIWKDDLFARLEGDPAGLVVEISTGSSVAGVWEEFVLGRERFEAVFCP